MSSEEKSQLVPKIVRETRIMTEEDQLTFHFKELLDQLDASALLIEDVVYPRYSVRKPDFPEEWYKDNKQYLFYFAFSCDESFSNGNTTLHDGSEGDINHDITFLGSKIGLYKGQFNILDVPFEDGDIALDLGSNLGVCSIVLGGMNPNVRVVAFDANPLACKLFKINSLVNTVLNTEVYNLAVGKDALDSLDFYTDAEFNTCALPSEFKNEEHTNKASSVRQIQLKEIFNSQLLNIEKVRYAKIDIEGAEIPMLEDIIENDIDLLNKIEYLNIEIHNTEEVGEGYEERGKNLALKLMEIYKDKVSFQSSKPLEFGKKATT